jgi:hypothetical protein
MGHAKNQTRSWGVFRWMVAASLALLMPLGATTAPAGGTGGGDSTIRVTLSIPHWKSIPGGFEVVGGEAEKGTLELNQPVPSTWMSAKISTRITVNGALTKDVKVAPLVAKSLSLSAKANSVDCLVITSPIKKKEVVNVAVTLTITYPHVTTTTSVTTNHSITLEPTGVASVSMKPATVKTGGSASGVVTLKYPAPATVHYYKNVAIVGQPSLYQQQERTGGATVVLTSSNSAVQVPRSVQVPPGESSVKFTATASNFVTNAAAPPASSCLMGPNPLPVTIKANWEQSATGTLQVVPNSNTTSRYTSQTIRIDPNTIVGVSHDLQVVVLEPSDCANSLVAGNVMFLKHYGVLKVGAIKKVPINELPLSPKQLAMRKASKTTGQPQDGIAVGVSSASITDFINEGTMQVSREQPQPASEPGGADGSANPWADTAEPFEGQKPGEAPWKYKVTGTPNNYSFDASKQNGQLSASINAKGEVNGGYNFLAVIHGDKLQQLTYTIPTDGTLDVDWLVQTGGSGEGIGESRLRLPPLFSGLVDSADDIPFLFQIYANLIFKPGFGEKAAAQGHFKVTYKGEGGLDSLQPLNHGMDAQADITSTTSSARAAHGVVAAINAPRFAMSLSAQSFLWALANRLPSALDMKGADYADSLESQLSQSYADKHNVTVKYPKSDDYFDLPRAAWVQWVSSVAYAGAGMMGAGLVSPVPCQQYYQTFLAQAKVDKDLLGNATFVPDKKKAIEIFKKEKTTLIPPIKGCEPKK